MLVDIDQQVTTESLTPADETELTERYQVLRHLGSGGNGDSYLAGDTSLRLEVVKRTTGDWALSFRFLSGKAELDAKGVRDLERVVRFLARPENRDRRVYLLGLSDSSGTPAANLKLSKERVDEVARQLVMRGITIAETMPFGQELPVASNTTKGGQDKNRRVEVWVE